MEEKNNQTQKKSGGALKVLGIVGAVFVGVIALLYVLFIMPASPKAVCQNELKLVKKGLTELTKKEYTDAEVEKQIGSTVDECIKDETDWRGTSTIGLLNIAKRTRCEAKAETIDAFKACSKK